MVQLNILSGKMAGATWVARRFPVRVGRCAASDLQLEEQGVWDEHFQINLDPAAGFILETRSNALVTANGQQVQHAALRNGDLIEIGSLKMQFWLGATRQCSLRISECFVWVMITAIVLGQIALVYWLPR